MHALSSRLEAEPQNHVKKDVGRGYLREWSASGRRENGERNRQSRFSVDCAVECENQRSIISFGVERPSHACPYSQRVRSHHYSCLSHTISTTSFSAARRRRAVRTLSHNLDDPVIERLDAQNPRLVKELADTLLARAVDAREKRLAGVCGPGGGDGEGVLRERVGTVGLAWGLAR